MNNIRLIGYTLLFYISLLVSSSLQACSDTNPCGTGSTCADTRDETRSRDYTCTCDDNYALDSDGHCEFTLCNDVECENGTCGSSTDGTAMCTCDTGFSNFNTKGMQIPMECYANCEQDTDCNKSARCNTDNQCTTSCTSVDQAVCTVMDRIDSGTSPNCLVDRTKENEYKCVCEDDYVYVEKPGSVMNTYDGLCKLALCVPNTCGELEGNSCVANSDSNDFECTCAESYEAYDNETGGSSVKHCSKICTSSDNVCIDSNTSCVEVDTTPSKKACISKQCDTDSDCSGDFVCRMSKDLTTMRCLDNPCEGHHHACSHVKNNAGCTLIPTTDVGFECICEPAYTYKTDDFLLPDFHKQTMDSYLGGHDHGHSLDNHKHHDNAGYCEAKLCENFDCVDNASCTIHGSLPRCYCHKGYSWNNMSGIRTEECHINCSTNENCTGELMCDTSLFRPRCVHALCHEYGCRHHKNCVVEAGKPLCECDTAIFSKYDSKTGDENDKCNMPCDPDSCNEGLVCDEGLLEPRCVLRPSCLQRGGCIVGAIVVPVVAVVIAAGSGGLYFYKRSHRD